MFVFLLCSRQKPWATGVRTLKTRPTGRRCSRPPKRVAARLSLCFRHRVLIWMCWLNRVVVGSRQVSVSETSQASCFFPLVLFLVLRLEEEDEEKRRVSAGSHTTTTTTEVLKIHTAFRLNVSVQTINSNVEEKKSGFCFFCVSSFLTQQQKHDVTNTWSFE